MFVKAMEATTRKRCATLPSDSLLIDAARLLSQPQVNLVAIVDGSELLAGVITKTDIVRQLATCSGNSCTLPAAAVMTGEVISCHPDEWLADVWARIRDRGLKCLPVISAERKVIGVLYARDALAALLEETTYEELLLRDYVLGVGYR